MRSDYASTLRQILGKLVEVVMSDSTKKHFTEAMAAIAEIDTDYMTVLIPYFTEIAFSQDVSDKIRKLRLDAFDVLKSRLAFYKDRGYMESLLCAIARKKAEMILETTTKTEMEKVMSLRPPHFDGNKFIPDKYAVPEEEMISWAETSYLAPLNEAGFQRYMELVKQILPEQAKIIFQE